MSAHFCPSCGVAYQDHAGLTIVCAEAVALRAEVAELKRLNLDLIQALETKVAAMEAEESDDLQAVIDSAGESDAEATAKLQAIMDAWADQSL